MASNDSEKILEQWETDINNYYKQYHPSVQKLKQLGCSADKKWTIWLGGPGRKHKLFLFRTLLKKILQKENFDVLLSEELHGGPDLASKELNEISALDIVFLLIITPGSSGEAIEFAHVPNIRPKFWIFFPKEYSDGYIYRSLEGRHRLLSDECMFSLEEINSYSSSLVIKILERAIQTRIDLIRKEKMDSETNFQTICSLTRIENKLDTLICKFDSLSIELNEKFTLIDLSIKKSDIYEEFIISVGIELSGTGITKKIHINSQNFSYPELKEDLNRYLTMDDKSKQDIKSKILSKIKDHFINPVNEKAIEDGFKGDNPIIYLSP